MTVAQNIAAYDPLKDPNAPVQFQTLDEIKPYESVTALFYGGAGTGKTLFGATAGPRTLIINIGDGLVTIMSPLVKAKYYKDGMPIVAEIREERDHVTGLFKTADAFDKIMSAVDWAMDKFPERFDTIFVDDATQLRAFAMNKGLEWNALDEKSRTLKKAQEFGGFIPAVQDYQAEMDFVEKFVAETVSFCKRDKKHFILTAHERHIFKKVRDQTGKVIGEELDKVRPGFTGKTFPDDITAFFDLVWNFQVVQTGKGPVYRAMTEDSQAIKAKSRYPYLFKNPEISPNFLEIVTRIKESWDAGNLVIKE